MPRLAYTDDIHLRFCNTLRRFKNFVARPLARNLACKILSFCRENRIREHG